MTKPSLKPAMSAGINRASTDSVNALEFACALTSPFQRDLRIEVSAVDAEQTGKLDISDDLQLEAYFQRQALFAAVAARARLIQSQVPFTRPPTYHGHLLKTSAHLQRIQTAASKEAKAREARQAARLQRQQKKTAKDTQRTTLERRQAEKTATIRAVNDLRKRKRDGNDFDVQTVVEGIVKDGPSGPAKRSRQWRNEKYGPASKDSRLSTPGGGRVGAGKKDHRPQLKQRPGKSRRHQMRNKKGNRK